MFFGGRKSRSDMRHGKKRSKLSMMTAHRKATMRNMVKNLFKYQKINTTLARAKEARRLAERLITISKDDTVFARRRVFAYLTDRDMVGKLFKEITPLFKTRTSGFTRIIPLGFRRGDGATTCILELTEKSVIEKLPKKKKAKAEEAKTDSPSKAVKQEAVKEARVSKEEHKKSEKAEEPGTKAVPKSKPTLAEEKRAEKARSEDKKLADNRGFMKNIRGIFRKRGDR